MTDPRFRALAAALASLGAVLLLTMGSGGCRPSPAPNQPRLPVPTAAPPAAKLVWGGSYSKHIQPIFDQSCAACHGRDRAENGLRLTSFADVMRGTQYGAVVVPGYPTRSTLVSVISGTADLSIRMPRGERRLNDQEVQNLVLWIEAGAHPE